MSTAVNRCKTLRRHVVRDDLRRTVVASYSGLTAIPPSCTRLRFVAIPFPGRFRPATLRPEPARQGSTSRPEPGIRPPYRPTRLSPGLRDAQSTRWSRGDTAPAVAATARCEAPVPPPALSPGPAGGW